MYTDELIIRAWFLAIIFKIYSFMGCSCVVCFGLMETVVSFQKHPNRMNMLMLHEDLEFIKSAVYFRRMKKKPVFVSEIQHLEFKKKVSKKSTSEVSSG